MWLELIFLFMSTRPTVLYTQYMKNGKQKRGKKNACSCFNTENTKTYTHINTRTK